MGVIRAATRSDSDGIARIYDHYVHNTTITFEEDPVPPDAIAYRIEKVASAGLPYLVIEQGDRFVGYAYASRWHERAAYRYSVETSIYLDPECLGLGHGTQLYATLLEQLRSRGLHVAIGGIALPNPGSVALHEKLGFRIAAQYHEVGFKFGTWIDVGYWQLIL
jgi:phosphinothricin acetyltransferase